MDTQYRIAYIGYRIDWIGMKLFLRILKTNKIKSKVKIQRLINHS